VNSLRPAIVAISGPIGSGKTTTASLLSQRTGWPRTSYGDAVRASDHRGIPHDRGDLQRIGTELIASGWDAFSRRALDLAAWQPGEPAIVEGVRHAPAIAALRRIARPLPVIAIYLDLPAGAATTRASMRDSTTPEQGQFAAAHPVEQDLPAVRALADLVVIVLDRAPEAIAEDIVSYLAGRVGTR
jgi:hypothetical protein